MSYANADASVSVIRRRAGDSTFSSVSAGVRVITHAEDAPGESSYIISH